MLNGSTDKAHDISDREQLSIISSVLCLYHFMKQLYY